MKKLLIAFILGLSCVLSLAQDLKRTPVAWKWVSDTVAVFSYDGTFDDADAFGVDARSCISSRGPRRRNAFRIFPINPRMPST